MKKDNEQKVTVGSGASVGSITQIIRIGIPAFVIASVILIALTQMTGYDLRPVIDTALFGATPTPSYPLCTVTIRKDACLMIHSNAGDDAGIFGCLPDGTQIQVTGIADPYYQVSSYGIEKWIYDDNGFWVRTVEPNSPAQAAGMMAGDMLLQIDDMVLGEVTGDQMRAYSEQNVGVPLRIVIKRGGEEQTLVAIPREPIEARRGSRGPLGFTYSESLDDNMARGYVKGYSVSQSLKSMVETTVSVTSYVSCPTQLIQPNLFGQ